MKRRSLVVLIFGLMTSIAWTQEKPCQPLKHANLPMIKGLAYHKARELLLSAGWRPLQTIYPKTNELDMSGNGPFFWHKGYVELENCSGTGLASCSFLFKDAYGNRLRVVTTGEEDEEGHKYHAGVRGAGFVCGERK